jgi:hypothetical protein
MKLKSILGVLLLCVLCVSVVSAAAPTITQASGTLTTSGATITGTNTCDVTVNGVTNAATIRLFWGGSDGGTLSTAWVNSTQATGSFTNGQSYSIPITGMTAGRTIYYRSRIQDLSGEAWASATGSFTTSSTSGAIPDSGYREKIRLGTNTLTVVVIGGTNYTVGITSVIALDGSTNSVPILTSE